MPTFTEYGHLLDGIPLVNGFNNKNFYRPFHFSFGMLQTSETELDPLLLSLTEEVIFSPNKLSAV